MVKNRCRVETTTEASRSHTIFRCPAQYCAITHLYSQRKIDSGSLTCLLTAFCSDGDGCVAEVQERRIRLPPSDHCASPGTELCGSALLKVHNKLHFGYTVLQRKISCVLHFALATQAAPRNTTLLACNSRTLHIPGVVCVCGRNVSTFVQCSTRSSELMPGWRCSRAATLVERRAGGCLAKYIHTSITLATQFYIFHCPQRPILRAATLQARCAFVRPIRAGP